MRSKHNHIPKDHHKGPATNVPLCTPLCVKTKETWSDTESTMSMKEKQTSSPKKSSHCWCQYVTDIAQKELWVLQRGSPWLPSGAQEKWPLVLGRWRHSETHPEKKKNTHVIVGTWRNRTNPGHSGRKKLAKSRCEKFISEFCAIRSSTIITVLN